MLILVMGLTMLEIDHLKAKVRAEACTLAFGRTVLNGDYFTCLGSCPGPDSCILTGLDEGGKTSLFCPCVTPGGAIYTSSSVKCYGQVNDYDPVTQTYESVTCTRVACNLACPTSTTYDPPAGLGPFIVCPCQ